MIGFAARAESIPAFVGHVFDIGSHVSDVTIGELAAEGGHGVLAVGHLVSDGSFVAVAVVGFAAAPLPALAGSATSQSI